MVVIVCGLVSLASQPSDELKKKHRDFRGQGLNGKLLMGGRFTDLDGSLTIWKAESMEEVEKLASLDPYRVARLATFKLRQWNLTWDFTEDPPLQPSQ
ncbi:MAG: hypothetical protein JRN25_00085 [Nitrososphaerota archaeon]|jgi:uncharacterized protein YciI|nr:hypothetical protein [Nitrososphaerota archaeon]MDG7004261.1 hypothetical protein [Nitrososphaerota archaeon]